eukprot:82669_1
MFLLAVRSKGVEMLDLFVFFAVLGAFSGMFVLQILVSMIETTSHTRQALKMLNYERLQSIFNEVRITEDDDDKTKDTSDTESVTPTETSLPASTADDYTGYTRTHSRTRLHTPAPPAKPAQSAIPTDKENKNYLDILEHAHDTIEKALVDKTWMGNVIDHERVYTLPRLQRSRHKARFRPTRRTRTIWIFLSTPTIQLRRRWLTKRGWATSLITNLRKHLWAAL